MSSEGSKSVSTNNGSDDGANEEICYEKSEDYWAKQPATVNGMLGGFDSVSPADIEQSRKFLDFFLNSRSTNKNKCSKDLALDCGAGIGRITKNLLLKNFKNVDMVDVTENFIKTAKEYLGEDDSSRILNFYCSGLQSFQPEPNRYDCIWIQWVTGYLTDDDLVSFLKRCKSALKPYGLCILKENIAQTNTEFDSSDSSVTRTRQQIVNLIHKTGMRLIREEKQTNFPKGLFEVRMFAFK